MPIIENKVNKIEDEYPPVKESEKQKNHAELPQASQSEPIKLNNSVLASMAAKRQEKIDNPLKNTEMAIEENYNNIDGVLNNIPADKSENTKRNPKKTNPFSKEAISESAKTIRSKPKQVEDKNKSHQRSQGIEKE